MSTHNLNLKTGLDIFIYNLENGRGGIGDEIAGLLRQGIPPRGCQYELALILVAKRLAGGTRKTALFRTIHHILKRRLEHSFGRPGESLAAENPTDEYQKWLAAKLDFYRGQEGKDNVTRSKD